MEKNRNFLFTARKSRADHRAELCLIGNDKVHVEKAREGGEDAPRIARNGEVTRQNDVTHTAAARGKNGHHADRFIHHVEKADGKVGLGCHIADLTEVRCRQLGRHGFDRRALGKVPDPQVHVGKVTVLGQKVQMLTRLACSLTLQVETDKASLTLGTPVILTLLMTM